MEEKKSVIYFIKLILADAKDIDMNNNCNKIKMLRLFITEIYKSINNRTVIATCNQETLTWFQSMYKIRRAKHIDVRFHFIKEYFDRQII